MNLIILSGKMQSGKDTCANFLVDNYGAYKYSFAGPLKEMVSILFDVPIEKLFGSDNNKNELTIVRWDDIPFQSKLLENRYNQEFLTIRELLQLLGTDFFRKLNNDCWALATLNNIIEDQPELAVISDCRFPNEIEVFKNTKNTFQNIITIRLTRQIKKSEHESEIALDNYEFDYIIDNRNLTIQEQEKKLLEILEKENIV